MDGQLVANVVLMYAILVGINLPAPLLGLEFEESGDQARLPYAPPGYVIPIAWFVLFTLLGVARSMVAGTPRGQAGRSSGSRRCARRTPTTRSGWRS